MIEFSVTELILLCTNCVLAYLFASAANKAATYRERAMKAEFMVQIIVTNADAREKLVKSFASFEATLGEKNASTS